MALFFVLWCLIRVHALSWVIVNQQELFSRNLVALVLALDWGSKQQELSRNQKILHGGKILQEPSENSRNLEGLGKINMEQEPFNDRRNLSSIAGTHIVSRNPL